MIFDTHAHYDDEAFEEDREALLESLKDGGIGAVMNVAASLEAAGPPCCWPDIMTGCTLPGSPSQRDGRA